MLLADRIEQAIAQAERSSRTFAVLVVDLDRFKSINDSLGHEAGDALLRRWRERLRAVLRKVDTLARIGGDEFVMRAQRASQAPHDARSSSERAADVGQPLELDSIEVQTSPSIGISLYPHDGTDPQTLLKHADAAMYHAKKKGRNTFQFFAPDMNAFTRERLELENALRHAVCQRRVRPALPAEGELSRPAASTAPKR